MHHKGSTSQVRHLLTVLLQTYLHTYYMHTMLCVLVGSSPWLGDHSPCTIARIPRRSYLLCSPCKTGMVLRQHSPPLALGRPSVRSPSRASFERAPNHFGMNEGQFEDGVGQQLIVASTVARHAMTVCSTARATATASQVPERRLDSRVCRQLIHAAAGSFRQGVDDCILHTVHLD